MTRIYYIISMNNEIAKSCSIETNRRIQAEYHLQFNIYSIFILWNTIMNEICNNKNKHTFDKNICGKLKISKIFYRFSLSSNKQENFSARKKGEKRICQ